MKLILNLVIGEKKTVLYTTSIRILVILFYKFLTCALVTIYILSFIRREKEHYACALHFLFFGGAYLTVGLSVVLWKKFA